MKNETKLKIQNLLDKIKNPTIIRILATFDRIFLNYKILRTWFDFTIETNRIKANMIKQVEKKYDNIKRREWTKFKDNLLKKAGK